MNDAGHEGPESGLLGTPVGVGEDDGSSQSGTGSPAQDAAASLFSAQQVQQAIAMCTSADGPVDAYATVGELKARIVGSWWACPSSAVNKDPYATPITYTADGDWYRLLSDGQGGLIHGWGVDNQGTYAPSLPPSGEPSPDAGDSQPADVNVYMYYGNGGFNVWETTFEMSPRRMHVIVATAAWVEWYVPIGP